MSVLMQLLVGVLLGIGATASIDAWNTTLYRLFGVASLDYCLLGRWVGHIPRGLVRHRSIAAAARTPFECVLGWIAHYSIGIALAVLFVFGAPGWLTRPTVVPAVAYGILTVVFPFFILQPALGLGVASSAARRPVLARMKSLATHTVYGLGLYAWAWVLKGLIAV